MQLYHRKAAGFPLLPVIVLISFIPMVWTGTRCENCKETLNKCDTDLKKYLAVNEPKCDEQKCTSECDDKFENYEDELEDCYEACKDEYSECKAKIQEYKKKGEEKCKKYRKGRSCASECSHHIRRHR